MTEVTLIRSMGFDDSVADAARVSLAKRAEWYSPGENAKLIQFLARNGHWTPFAHCFATFHVRVPIFVARQLVKHSVGFAWNEVSRRYVDFEPAISRPQWRSRAPGKKQGSAGPFPKEGLAVVNQAFDQAAAAALSAYDRLLKLGVAPEQARAVLPVAAETEAYWSGSLAAWGRFYKLRTAPDAQAETAEVAHLIGLKMGEAFPVSWAALTA